MELVLGEQPGECPFIQSNGHIQVDDMWETEFAISEFQIDGDILCATRLIPAVIVWNWRTGQRAQMNITRLNVREKSNTIMQCQSDGLHSRPPRTGLLSGYVIIP